MSWRWSALRWLGIILVVVVSFSGTGYCADKTIDLDSVRESAEQGLPSAQFLLGMMYDNGQGVPVNYKEAIKWYSKAAEQGDADAQFLLGGMYDNGQGTPVNYQEAMKWYSKAAEQGDAYAQLSLGYLYAQGQGVPKNYTKAVKQSPMITKNTLKSLMSVKTLIWVSVRPERKRPII